MEHVGIVVDDLPAAIEFFVELGLELAGEGLVEGRRVDRVRAGRADRLTGRPASAGLV
jgi:catechol 2,3-dioxygenase-like lactoylglutathione lyase family enzyme